MIRSSPDENSVAKAARMLSSGFIHVRSWVAAIHVGISLTAMNQRWPSLRTAIASTPIEAQHAFLEIRRQSRLRARRSAAVATRAAVSSFSCSQTLRKLAIEGM